MNPLNDRELEIIRRRFAMLLANLQSVRVYFSPSLRKILARAATFDETQVFNKSRGRRPLPFDIVFVGVYSHPFNSSTFVREDLHDAIARFQRSLA